MRACSTQYGPSPCRRPQNVKPSEAGSPMGHLHICAPMVRMVAEPGSSSRYRGSGTVAVATGFAGASTGTTRRGAEGMACAAGRTGRGALNARRAGCEGWARPESPSRCTLPITPLRVTPPSCLAIWLAESPSSQSFFKVLTRSSVQLITSSFRLVSHRDRNDVLQRSDVLVLTGVYL